MVKKLVSIGIVGGIAAVSACFGDGPTPAAPGDAVILATAAPGQNCNQGTYVGPVAFGSERGYVSFLPYSPQGGNCNGGGGPGGQTPQTVYSFSLAGGSLEKVGSAGEINNNGGVGHVQLAAVGSGVAYVFDAGGTMMGGGATVEPGGVMIGGNMGTELPLGIFAAGSNLYVATTENATTTGGQDLEHPNFPNGGGGAFGVSPGKVWMVGSNATPADWTPSCGALDRCIVGNDTSFTYVGQDPIGAGNWAILQTPLAGGTPLRIASAEQNSVLAPFGLDVDSHQVVWSTSETCVQNMNGGQIDCRMTTCNVFDYDTAAAMPKVTTLFSTEQFACLDAKLANGYVYFAIVTISTENNQMIGRGIGRVSIAGRSLETLDLGIKTPTTGARRIFPIGDQLYLVDPFVIARIPASALDGKHDFTP
jgi:hypothetical protein